MMLLELVRKFLSVYINLMLQYLHYEEEIKEYLILNSDIIFQDARERDSPHLGA